MRLCTIRPVAVPRCPGAHRSRKSPRGPPLQAPWQHQHHLAMPPLHGSWPPPASRAASWQRSRQQRPPSFPPPAVLLMQGKHRGPPPQGRAGGRQLLRRPPQRRQRQRLRPPARTASEHSARAGGAWGVREWVKPGRRSLGGEGVG